MHILVLSFKFNLADFYTKRHIIVDVWSAADNQGPKVPGCNSFTVVDAKEQYVCMSGPNRPKYIASHHSRAGLLFNVTSVNNQGY